MFKARTEWSDAVITYAPTAINKTKAYAFTTGQASIIKEGVRTFAPYLTQTQMSDLGTTLVDSDSVRQITPGKIYFLTQLIHMCYLELRKNAVCFPISLYDKIVSVEGQGYHVTMVKILGEKTGVIERYVRLLNRHIPGPVKLGISNGVLIVKIPSVITRETFPILSVLAYKQNVFSFYRNCLKYGNPI